MDLTRGGWPTYLVDYLNDSPPLLRYYLGWHMVPALLGRWLGPAALDWAVPLWTWCEAALVVLLFARGLPTLRAALAAVARFYVDFHPADPDALSAGSGDAGHERRAFRLIPW